MLPLLDREDYERCIKGFIYTAKQIIDYEKEEFKINADLTGYFFNDRIKKLSADRTFLLEKIQQASNKGNLLDDKDKAITPKVLDRLRKEPHLLLFLEF